MLSRPEGAKAAELKERPTLGSECALPPRPKASGEALRVQHAAEPLNCLEYLIFSMTHQAKHDDARRSSGWVGANIREIGVQRDEDPVFLSTNACDNLILSSSKAFVKHRGRVMTSLGEEACCLPGQVLIELEPHSSSLSSRYADNPLSCELRGIGDGCLNALSLQGRVAGQYLLGLHASGEVVENYRDHDPRSAEAGPTVADIGSHANMVLPFHLGTLPGTGRRGAAVGETLPHGLPTVPTGTTSNGYGKRPKELAEVLHHLEGVEPLLRRSATHEIVTTMPLDRVVAAVLSLAQASASP